jgi:hypothetical protein
MMSRRIYLKIAQQTGYEDGEGKAYGNLGICYLLQEPRSARESHRVPEEALIWRQRHQTRDVAGGGITRYNLSNAYAELHGQTNALGYRRFAHRGQGKKTQKLRAKIYDW